MEFTDGDDDDEYCEYCEGCGCEECDEDFELEEEEIVQCHGITQRGARCQITSLSVDAAVDRIAKAAEPLTYGSRYCTFHTDQEGDDASCECYECNDDGCPECCPACWGKGCEACLRDMAGGVPGAPRTEADQEDDEVAFVGSRTRDERDAEARVHAIDVEAACDQMGQHTTVDTSAAHPELALTVAASASRKPTGTRRSTRSTVVKDEPTEPAPSANSDDKQPSQPHMAGAKRPRPASNRAAVEPHTALTRLRSKPGPRQQDA